MFNKFLILLMVVFGWGEPTSTPQEIHPTGKYVWETVEDYDRRVDDEREVLELERMLTRAGAPKGEIPALARSFHKYGKEVAVDPKLLVAIAAVESNFHASARSHAGAIGIMQVMPVRKWWGKYEEPCGARLDRTNLTDADTNICFGAYIYRWFRDHHGNRRAALYAYNNGSGKPNGYADKVLRRFERL